MANLNHYKEALTVVMLEILNSPDRFKLERNRHNSKTITVTVYKSKTRGVEITIKTNGVILMVADGKRVEGLQGQLYGNYKPLKSWDKSPIMWGAQYGYEEVQAKSSGISTNTSNPAPNHYSKWVHDFNLL